MKNKLEVTQHIVAFIDIMGSSDAIKNNSQSSLEVMHSAYQSALDLFNRFFDNKNIQPKIKIFSDNISIAVPCDIGFEKPCFLAVAMMSGIIQMEFLKRNYLTRGGIVIGDYFCDDVMVWGNALVKAYELESKVAFYPRVIIDPELVGKLNLTSEDKKSRCGTWINQDEDYLFCVDYVNEFLKDQLVFVLGTMNMVETKIVKYNSNIKVCQKWLWLQKYLAKKLYCNSDEGDEKTDV